jgi:hypothetical protein
MMERGRPKLAGKERRVTVKTRCEPRKVHRIALYARTEGKSIGRLIDEYIARQIGTAHVDGAR